MLRSSSIVLQGHAVRALAKIAAAHRWKAKPIFGALVDTADAFPGNKVGFVVEAMEPFIAIDGFDSRIRGFVEPYTKSEIAVVARKAGKILKKLERKRKER